MDGEFTGSSEEMSGDWAASALGWWHDAGVDTIVAEAPRNWLKPADAAQPAPADAPDAAVQSGLPGDLAAFRRWLAESPELPLSAPTARRFAPEGDPAANLMIMVSMPGREGLVDGAEGALLDRMLKAIGYARDSIYLAPLSPIRAPTGRLNAGDLKMLGPIARHHVALVKPRALLLFGDACAQALVGAPVSGARGRWHEVETPTGPIRAIATIRPEDMERTPGLKKLAWEDLQMLMEGLKA